jgi:hypothetical protein
VRKTILSLIFLLAGAAVAFGFGKLPAHTLYQCGEIGWRQVSPLEIFVWCDDNGDGKPDYVLVVLPGKEEWKAGFEYTVEEADVLLRCYYKGDCADFMKIIGDEDETR